jgi:Flp pilus assembly protein TadD
VQLAIEAFSKAVRRNPRLAGAYHGRGVAYAIQGDFDRALNDCEKAIRLNPAAPRFYRARGLILREIAEQTKARSDLRMSRQLSGQNRAS